jgi:hypothetical protein
MLLRNNYLLYMKYFLNVLAILFIQIFCLQDGGDNIYNLRDLEFARNYTEKLKNIQINFPINFDINSQGLKCEANQNLFESQIIFKIPQDVMICSFDYFPFQIEIKETIQNFLSKKFKDMNETNFFTNEYLFAYNLLYLMNRNKSLNEDFKASKLSSYYINISKDKSDYIDNLSQARETYSSYMYSNQDRKLFELVFSEIREYYLEETFEHVMTTMNYKYAQNAHLILPWISDFQLFRRALSLIGSRAFDFSLEAYEAIKNQSFPYMQLGYLRKDKMKDILRMPGKCLIPLLELCNNRSSSKKIPFDIIPYTGGIKFTMMRSFTKGEIVEFNDKFYLPNEQLVLSTGSFIEDNPNSLAYFSMKVSKKHYTEVKNRICSILKCFDSPLDSFIQNEKQEEAEILIPLRKNIFHERILNFLRLYLLKRDFVDKKESEVTEILLRGQILSNKNELQALTAYRSQILDAMGKSELKLVQVFIKFRRILFTPYKGTFIIVKLKL